MFLAIFFHFFLGSGSARGWTKPNFQVQVQPLAKPNIMFRFRFGAKSAEPEPNRTVASVFTGDVYKLHIYVLAYI